MRDVIEGKRPRPVALVILDGWGWREDKADNAVRQARTPAFDALWARCPHAFLHTCGADVGLPDGQMGNSEVGHLNIGAGRVVKQDLPRIDEAVRTGALAGLEPLQGLIRALKESGGTCHLAGLLSPGGVHAHRDHAVALARILAEAGVTTVLHAFTDGRDTPPRSAAGDIDAVEAALPDGVRIASVSGRYYAMDRDHRWDRVAKAYRAMVTGDGPRFAAAGDVVADAYARDVTDEFIEPAAVGDYAGMRDGDALLCFNIRADRARQLLAALLDPAFDGFERSRTVRFAAAVGLVQYSADLDRFLQTLFPPVELPHVLGAVVADAGLAQVRLAETEKYPHVTYFLNGGEETPFKGQDNILVPSPKVATYDLQPEMSAPELARRAVEAVESGRYDLLVLNFANADMVGHTGVLAAAIKAVETVDGCLGRLAAAIREAGGALLVTADHGNAELMRDPQTGAPHTAHTLNLVPVLLDGGPGGTLAEGRLADLAPTLLALLGLPQPAEMTGRSLIRAPA